MKFDDFLNKLKKKYGVEQQPDGQYVVSRGDRSIFLHESNTYNPADIDRFFEGGGAGNVGEDDLTPFAQPGRGVRGSRVDPKSGLFQGSSSSSDNLVHVDPITPAGGRMGFDPDPDHLKKPDDKSRFPF